MVGQALAAIVVADSEKLFINELAGGVGWLDRHCQQSVWLTKKSVLRTSSSAGMGG